MIKRTKLKTLTHWQLGPLVVYLEHPGRVDRSAGMHLSAQPLLPFMSISLTTAEAWCRIDARLGMRLVSWSTDRGLETQAWGK